MCVEVWGEGWAAALEVCWSAECARKAARKLEKKGRCVGIVRSVCEGGSVGFVQLFNRRSRRPERCSIVPARLKGFALPKSKRRRARTAGCMQGALGESIFYAFDSRCRLAARLPSGVIYAPTFGLRFVLLAQDHIRRASSLVCRPRGMRFVVSSRSTKHLADSPPLDECAGSVPNADGMRGGEVLS